MKALNGLAIYNSGEESGASQPHRHIQIVPQTSEFKQPISDQIDAQVAKDKVEQGSIFIFNGFKRITHLGVRLRPFDPEVEIVDTYSEYLHSKYLELLKNLKNEPLSDSYNLLWKEDWMLVVLRDKSLAFNRYSVNSFGFTGSLLAKTEEDLENLAEHTPTDILIEIGVPHIYEQVD